VILRQVEAFLDLYRPSDWAISSNKLGETSYSRNRTHSIHFDVIPDPNHSGCLDLFPDLDRNPGSHWFSIKD